MANAKFLDFLDMIDGGGAGKMGDKFEGGGIFSALANIVAKPYGSEDEARKRARMQALGLLNTGMDMSKPPAAPTVTPVLRPKPKPNMNALDPFGGAGPNVTGAAAERGMGLDPFGGAGPNVTGVAAERQMGLDPFGGVGPNVTGVAAERGMGLDPFGGAGAQFMNQVRGAANRQPAGTPTSMYEPSPEDMMRQKMISAGYNPTGLGAYEMRLFIDAMGL